ncbi:hypothetical protein BJ508DRAFT_148157 [Ascobolus immersus RN42]|uniref:Transmembrane protein n=1 Tax=Ascobolus immersus RN42 TaxID=1160509 RepID=A0A3N4IKP9_ASCIM|nr:hypothetical protein BJ508DRAFT_148157 [Ascobolus immersus RN42]
MTKIKRSNIRYSGNFLLSFYSLYFLHIFCHFFFIFFFCNERHHWYSALRRLRFLLSLFIFGSIWRRFVGLIYCLIGFDGGMWDVKNLDTWSVLAHNCMRVAVWKAWRTEENGLDCWMMCLLSYFLEDVGYLVSGDEYSGFCVLYFYLFCLCAFGGFLYHVWRVRCVVIV